MRTVIAPANWPNWHPFMNIDAYNDFEVPENSFGADAVLMIMRSVPWNP